MTFKISPHEFQVTGDTYTIQTRVPKQALDDGTLVLDRVRNNNLAAGRHILVQAMSHDYGELLAEAEFVVVSRRGEIKTVKTNDRDERTFEDTIYGVVRKGPWWDTPIGIARAKEAAATAAEAAKPKKAAA